MYYEAEDLPIGVWVVTPSGRRAQVIKHLSGSSKFDCFSRVMIRYEGGGPKDLATLQPHLLRPAEQVRVVGQLALAF